MVGWVKMLVTVCMIMREDSDGTLEYERCFKGGGQNVYNERSFGVGGFPFFYHY